MKMIYYYQMEKKIEIYQIEGIVFYQIKRIEIYQMKKIDFYQN